MTLSLSAFVAEILRFFLMWLLLAASIGKLQHYASFQTNLHLSFGLHPKFSQVFAPALILAELLVALSIAVLSPYWGMLCALLMFICFTLVLAYKFVTESIVKCDCFGESKRSLSGYDLLRNGLVILAICGWFALGNFSNGWFGPQSLLALALGIWLSVVAVEFHDIIVLLRT